MKILYIGSGHPVLEFDDLTLFTELGYDWLSMSHYFNPQIPTSTMRPPIDKIIEPSLYSEILRSDFDPLINTLNNFDIIFISNSPAYLEQFWPILKNKKVIYRSHDNPTHKTENLLRSCQLEGLILVRMFDWENNLSFSTKSDYVISHYVDKDTYKGWAGNELAVLTFQNDFRTRLSHVDEVGIRVYDNYEVYSSIIKDFPFKLVGYNNQVSYSSPPVDWTTQKEMYKSHRAYFSLGTKPSWYTYNLMEALMTGMPTINFGPNLGGSKHPHYGGTYTLPDVIENGINGFYSDNSGELVDIAKELVSNEKLAKSISVEARKLAIKLFSKEDKLQQWKLVLSS